ncbi:MAG: 4Fe-4S binding protein [Victivallales bacterium]|nr:4Fe-4S binding protein [Victivallales bacterium]
MPGAVYTVENECQDCYKCVRHCHSKAIRIIDAKASVIQEACVACGECVKVCPAHAKRIRSDSENLWRMLENGDRLFASIAPSFVGYFRNVSIGQLADALIRAGFEGVSETAHGAQAVSSRLDSLLVKEQWPLMISSACPAVVSYVEKYYPDFARYISPVQSPVMSHCRMLREAYGNDIKTVFFGPCAAKKNESDSHSDVLSLALTFADLEQFLLKRYAPINDRESPLALGSAAEGRFYSIEGGMNDTLRNGQRNVRFLSVSGLENLARLLQGDVSTNGRTLFIEALACHGGCVNGPAMPQDGSVLETLFHTDSSAPIASSAGRPQGDQPHFPGVPKELAAAEVSEEEIKEALARVGKFGKSDELNCGACGYNTCRDFAKALLDGKAEPDMCHNYLRQNFQKKSNALIKYIPASVVLVDGDLKICECNRNFAVLIKEEEIYQTLGNLNSLPIESCLPAFKELFASVIGNGGEIEKYHQAFGERIIDISVFSITRGKCAGAVISDVTQNEFKRERIAQQAREVIRKNVYTVQQVARLFGEHIAETEIMLNEIAGTYEAHPGEHHEG